MHPVSVHKVWKCTRYDQKVRDPIYLDSVNWIQNPNQSLFNLIESFGRRNRILKLLFTVGNRCKEMKGVSN